MEKKTDTISLDDIKQIASYGEQTGQEACLIIIAGNNTGQMFSMSSEQCIIGRDSDADITIHDSAASRQHAKISRDDTGRFYIEDLNSTNGTYCNGESIIKIELNDGDKISIGGSSILKFNFQDTLEIQFQKHIYDSAVKDSLTKCYNKRSFLSQLDLEYAYAERHQQHLSLLLIDIDFFKKVNDTYGHLAGDYVLKELSKKIHEIQRTGDYFARYGGEEFALILRETNREQSFFAAERIRRAIEEFPFEYLGQVLTITISVGCSSFDGTTPKSAELLIEIADELLYLAKRNGRNRTEVEMN